MQFTHGVEYLAIPGPSVVPQAVLSAMHRAAPNIYSAEMTALMLDVLAKLKRVADTKGHLAAYIANGHGAWEAAIANSFNPGDRALALATGRFTHGWSDMAEASGVVVDRLDFGRSGTIDLAQVEAALTADTGHEIRAVLMAHVDTSSSVLNDVPALRALLDRLGHPALLMIDCIASLACDEFHMDDWGVDVMVAGCQKGLMTPPGVSFVFFNDKADQNRDRVARVSSYWDWRPRMHASEFYQFFCGTAPTHHVFGLDTALEMLLSEGMEAVWARHSLLSRAVWAAAEAWGQGGPMRLNIADPALRSNAVTALSLGTGNASRLRDWVEQNADVTLGIGIGMATEDDPTSSGYFRIGHMGHVNAQMIMGVLGAIDAGLKALDIPHGSGALEAASAVLSGRHVAVSAVYSEAG